MTTILHNPRCTTSRKAVAKLEEAGAALDVVLYLRVPLDRAALASLLGRLEDSPGDLVRKDRRFKELGLDAADYTTRAAVVELLAGHPELMQRPVIDDGTRAFIGRPLSRVDAFTDS